jgi:hypothetical protein
MIRTRLALAAAAALAVAIPAAARAQATPAAYANGAAAARGTPVPEGTEFYVVTTEDLTSKSASPGQRVSMKVDENVLVNGVLVIAKGTPVRAEVGEAKGAGMFGKGGKLSLRIESTTAVDGQKVQLRGSPSAAGKSRTGSMVAVTALVSPLGVFIKGKNATYPTGTRLTVYTDEVLTVTPAAARAQ